MAALLLSSTRGCCLGAATVSVSSTAACSSTRMGLGLARAKPIGVGGRFGGGSVQQRSAVLKIPGIRASPFDVASLGQSSSSLTVRCRAGGQGKNGPSQKRRKKNAKILIQKFDKMQKKSRGELEDQVKMFDEVVLSVRSGDGGDGEIANDKKTRTVRNFKYRPGSNIPKTIELPPGKPTCGGDGGDVILYCEPSMDSLVPLHEYPECRAKNGSKGDPSLSLSPTAQEVMPKGESLRIPVPPGTAVKRKRGGALLGELSVAGQQLRVARGGRGGVGVRAPSKKGNALREQKRREQEEEGVAIVEDIDWKADAKGLKGEEVQLRLVMRVVSDVGLVGLPNAGKSSLLSCLTKAEPEVAPYPFTTLVPNLGVLRSGNVDIAADDDIDWDKITDEQLQALSYQGMGGAEAAQGAVLADLPGLIEGAHKGKGLGRVFLRHLRRSRVLLHVVDAASHDPVGDYMVVREELKMYNPEYVDRPHLVALNKLDYFAPTFPEALPHGQEIADRLMQAAVDSGCGRAPEAVVPISAINGEGVEPLLEALKPMLDKLGQKRGADPLRR